MPWNLAARLDDPVTALADFREQLRRELPAHATRDETVLLTNELATNAVPHGQPPIDVQVTVANNVVRVEVHDEHPQMGPPDHESRGLMIIDRVARAWGVTYERGDGKIVWAEIPIRPADELRIIP